MFGSVSGLLQGYLPSGSFRLCLKALFMPTNECANCWSSIIAVAVFAWHLWRASTLMLDETVYLLPYRLTIVSMLLSWIMSLLGHTFMSVSASVADFLFCLDYAGLSGLPIGVSMSLSCYTFPRFTPQPLMGGMYLPVTAVLSLTSSIVSCCTRLPSMQSFPHKLTLRAVSQGVPYAWVMFPLFLYGCPPLHRWHPPLIVVAVALYVSRWPETLFPGRFDIWCHSHTGFHVVSSVSLCGILWAVRWDMRASPPLPAHSHWWAEVGYGCTMALVFFAAVCFSGVMVLRCDRNRPWAPSVSFDDEISKNSGKVKNKKTGKTPNDVSGRIRLLCSMPNQGRFRRSRK